MLKQNSIVRLELIKLVVNTPRSGKRSYGSVGESDSVTRDSSNICHSRASCSSRPCGSLVGSGLIDGGLIDSLLSDCLVDGFLRNCLIDYLLRHCVIDSLLSDCSLCGGWCDGGRRCCESTEISDVGAGSCNHGDLQTCGTRCT